MKRISTLLTVIVLMACGTPVLSTAAQTVTHTFVKPKSAQGDKVSMRHDQLTLYPRGRPAHRQKAYSAFPHRFDQPTPIHDTFMGVQRWRRAKGTKAPFSLHCDLNVYIVQMYA
jgi:hypothetical protein